MNENVLESELAEHQDAPRVPASRRHELIIAGVILAAGVVVVILAGQIATAVHATSFGPTWWPTALGSALIVGGIVLAVQAFIKVVPAEEEPTTRHGIRVLLAIGLLIVLYGVAWNYVDFRVVTPLLLAGLVFVSGGRGIRALLVFPVITTAILWGVFGMLLRVPL